MGQEMKTQTLSGWWAEDAERVNKLAEAAKKIACKIPARKGKGESSVDWEDAVEGRAYCPTGEGNGTDNSCSSTGSKASKAESLAKSMPKEISAEVARERLPGYKPFRPIGDSKNSDHIGQATDDELRQFLKDSKDPDKSQKGKVGGSRDLPEGTPVALRIDIPAFNKSEGKTYAVTVHEGKPQGGKKAFGKALGYDSLAKLKGDVRFDSEDEGRATVVAAGGGKTPLAVVNGKFDPSRNIPDDIDSWTPVGYDPAKSTYFYDKRTGDEIVGGTDAVSVGNTVFTRDPVRGPRNVKTRYRSEDRADEEFSDPSPPMHNVGQPVLSDDADDDAAKSASIVQSAIGRPDRLVKVYRPFRKGQSLKRISSGDMVTISRVQAAKHGKKHFGGDFEIVSKVVQAKSLYSGSDGLHEWGYSSFEDESRDHDAAQAESRDGADCGRDDGGRFGSDNKCQKQGDGTGDSQPSDRKPATTQEVVDEILRSIEETGGFSVHPMTAESPTTGFMCATVPNAEKIIDSKEEVTEKLVDEYFAQHKDYLSSRPKLHLGGWINAEEGKVYLDLSERFETQEEAEKAAIEHKQIAIWDVKNKKEIRINHGDKRSAEENGEVRLSSRSVVEGDRSGDRGGEEESGPRVRGSEGESRAAGDCGRVEGGRFGPRNDCASEDGLSEDVASAKVLKASESAAGFGVATDPMKLLKHVGKSRQYEIIGAVANNFGRNASDNAEAAVEMVIASGYSGRDVEAVGEYVTRASRTVTGRAAASAAVGVLLAAKHACPEVEFEVSHNGEVEQHLGSANMSVSKTPAYYRVLQNKIILNLDAQMAGVAMTADQPDWFSTTSLAHAVAHEDGHKIHFEAIRDHLGISRDLELLAGMPEFDTLDRFLSELHGKAVLAVQPSADSILGTELNDEIRALSGYAVNSAQPREAVAEYYARVRLGGKRTASLDRFMELMMFPMDRLDIPKQGKKK